MMSLQEDKLLLFTVRAHAFVLFLTNFSFVVPFSSFSLLLYDVLACHSKSSGKYLVPTTSVR